MKRMVWSLALVAGAILPISAQAQIGIAARGGTFGVGGEVSFDINRHLGLRGGIGTIPIKPSGTFGDVDFKISPPSTLANAGIDIYPLGGIFRLSGGFLLNHDFSMEGQYTGTGTITINGVQYTGTQAGTVRGEFNYSSSAPYASFGFSGRGRGFGLSLDIGAAMLGAPDLLLTTNGTMAQNPTFLQNLLAEQQKDQDKANKYLKILPLVSLGIRIGI
jgi:hypothetical protein